MAAELKVSASYFNLLERNQRPVTAQVLLRLAEAYDLDLRTLSADEPEGEAGLYEVFADKMFADLSISRHEAADLLEAAPAAADAIVRLYRAYLDRGALIDLGALARRDGADGDPAEWVRDLVTAHHNHFAELEKLAERTVGDIGADTRDLLQWARQRLQQRFGVRTRIMPTDAMAGVLRKFDRHRKQLLIAESLATAGRLFAVAYTLGFLEHADAIDAAADRFEPPDAPRRNQLKVFLGNYLAAAIMMPYKVYLAALETTGYDLERVRTHFGVSYEQAAQRLTTLGRPGARGIPFFLVRIDAAGNISKRFSSGSFPFSRFGGTCPRWNVHDSFKTPGRIITQVIETPDGARYFTLSRTVRRVAGLIAGLEDELAIGLGCELRYADKLIYSRGLNMASPAIVEVGPACRICERALCPQRAATPVNKVALLAEGTKSITSFPFRS